MTHNVGILSAIKWETTNKQMIDKKKTSIGASINGTLKHMKSIFLYVWMFIFNSDARKKNTAQQRRQCN